MDPKLATLLRLAALIDREVVAFTRAPSDQPLDQAGVDRLLKMTHLGAQVLADRARRPV
jgi:hypothetical protein